MNRIVLIGNGFDLAHKLPTKYEDFVNWYWQQWGENLIHSGNKFEEDELYSFKLKLELGAWYLVWDWHYHRISNKKEIIQIVNLLKNDTEVCEMKEKSIFFHEICKAIETQNWVDIENVYYKFLRSFLKDTPKYEKPNILNKELNFIKTKLIEYLNSIQVNYTPRLNESIKQNILSPFSSQDISVSAKKVWEDFITHRIELASEEYWKFLTNYYDDRDDISTAVDNINSFKERYGEFLKPRELKFVPESEFPKELLLPEKIMLLNFNYTSIADAYLPTNERFTVNHIHGVLSNPESVIFGYGDELDENYKELIKLNENEYLCNMKTIRYSESSNYRNMLSFIESAPFQICIMGHSCGNSDRTLLNTLFEHKNCISIKPFYYQKEDGSDNYLDIVQNICRNFTDMQLMRDRVVNKTYCWPLSL